MLDKVGDSLRFRRVFSGAERERAGFSSAFSCYEFEEINSDIESTNATMTFKHGPIATLPVRIDSLKRNVFHG